MDHAGKGGVYLNGDTVSISQSSMTVKLDQDQSDNAVSAFTKNILPVLKEKVNFGDEFYRVRQIYNAVILATWFKGYVKGSAFHDAICNSNLVDITKNIGATAAQAVYVRYMDNIKNGTYNITKNKHKYYSGGITMDVRGTLHVLRGLRKFSSKSRLVDEGQYIAHKTRLLDQAGENIGTAFTKIPANGATREQVEAFLQAWQERLEVASEIFLGINNLGETSQDDKDRIIAQLDLINLKAVATKEVADIEQFISEHFPPVVTPVLASIVPILPMPLPNKDVHNNVNMKALADVKPSVDSTPPSKPALTIEQLKDRLEHYRSLGAARKNYGMLSFDEYIATLPPSMQKFSPSILRIIYNGAQIAPDKKEDKATPATPTPLPTVPLPLPSALPEPAAQHIFTAKIQAYQGAFTSACLSQCGIDAFAQGDRRKAEQFFLLAVQTETNNKQAYYNLAVTRLSVHNYAQAVRDFNQAIARGFDIKMIPNWYNLIDYALTCAAHTDPNFILRNQSEWNSIIGDKLKKKAMIIAQASVASGILHRNPLDFGAIEGLQRYLVRGNGALTDVGNFPVGDFSKFNHNVKGYYFVKEGAPDKAIPSFLEALKVDPENAQILSNLGACYAKTGDYPKATLYLRQAQKLTPNNTWLLNYIGYVKIEQGDYEGAIMEYDKALAINPKDTSCLRNSAAAYSMLGLHGMAARRLAQADDVDAKKEFEAMGSGLPSVTELMRRAIDMPIGMFETVKNWSPSIARIDVANILKKAMLSMDYNHRWMVLNLLDEWGEHVNSSTITDIAIGMMELTPQYVVDDSVVLGKYLSEGVVNELMAEAANSMGVDWIKSKCAVRPAKPEAGNGWVHSEDGTYLYDADNPSIRADLQGNVYGGGLPAFTQGKKAGGIEYKTFVGEKGKINIVYDSKELSMAGIKGFRAYIINKEGK